MRHHKVEQGSGEWLKLRLGIPTASRFHLIVTPAKWQLSASARRYAFRLVAETLLNEITELVEGTEWMERGKELEPRAVQMYEFESQEKTEPCGLLTTDDGLIGASPDRLIVGFGNPCPLELKCPAPWTQIEYLIDGFGADYLPQAQGQILIAEADFCDRYAFHPAMPPALVRTYRDDNKQTVLRQALTDFLDMRDEILERARASGFFAERRHLATALDQAYAMRREQ